MVSEAAVDGLTDDQLIIASELGGTGRGQPPDARLLMLRLSLSQNQSIMMHMVMHIRIMLIQTCLSLLLDCKYS